MEDLGKMDNSFQSYQRLAELYAKFENKSFQPISIGFSNWFAANMASALGGILDKINTNFNPIELHIPDSKVQDILLRNGFLEHFGKKRISDYQKTVIPYLKLKPGDGRYFSQYVTMELLSFKVLPDMTPHLKAKMTEAIYEIFVNAQTHSNTQNIYTCGQFFPKKNKIEFSITDTGIGFREKFRQRFDQDITAHRAIVWAVKDRHTTKKEVTGGIGLALLKEFIQQNQGKIQIISDAGYYEFGHNGEIVKPMKEKFPGTTVNLQFCTHDLSSYPSSTNFIDPKSIF